VPECSSPLQSGSTQPRPVRKPSAVLFVALRLVPRQHSPWPKPSWRRREPTPTRPEVKRSAVPTAGPNSPRKRRPPLTWKLRGGSFSSRRRRPRRTVVSRRRHGYSHGHLIWSPLWRSGRASQGTVRGRFASLFRSSVAWLRSAGQSEHMQGSGLEHLSAPVALFIHAHG
jgi:hypothetical protein